MLRVREARRERIDRMTEAIQGPTNMQPLFEKGDPVVHPHQGAGTIDRIITLKRNGEPIRYYSIALVESDSTLMMPVQSAEELGLRKANFGIDSIQEIFEDEPQELADHYRSRHATIRAMIAGGEPDDLARVVRDLAWRGSQPDTDLTKVDNDLLREARKILATEVAARAGVTLDAASRKIDEMIHAAIEVHQQGSSRKN